MGTGGASNGAGAGGADCARAVAARDAAATAAMAAATTERRASGPVVVVWVTGRSSGRERTAPIVPGGRVDGEPGQGCSRRTSDGRQARTGPRRRQRAVPPSEPATGDKRLRGTAPATPETRPTGREAEE